MSPRDDPATRQGRHRRRMPRHAAASYNRGIMKTACRRALALLLPAFLTVLPAFLTLLPAFLALLPAAAAFAQAGPYKVLRTDTVGGDGGYDYIAADSVDRRLYIARSGPTGVIHVYNLDTLAPLGDVATGSAHGAAIDPVLHHGFATSSPVSMFDTQTLKILKTIDTGGHPDGYLADTIAHRVYILSHVAPNVTVLDAHDGAILGTIDLGGAPEEAELDGRGHLFIDIEDKSAIAVVDTASMKMTGKYDISAHGGGCAGLAIDAAHNILFATCREKNNMIILNASDGKILADLPTGAGSDGAAFNPNTQEAFSTQGDGTLTIVKESSPTRFAVEQNLQTPPRARTLTLDTRTGHIFTQTAEFGPAPANPARPALLPRAHASRNLQDHRYRQIAR
jgi:DNA-binding beta-propeller fold protein YncE